MGVLRACLALLMLVGVVAGSWISASAVGAAEFWFEPIDHENDIAAVTLYGDIEEGDSARLVSALMESIANGHYIDSINLFSGGGNAAEGIKLGYVINRHYLETNAPRFSDNRFYCYGHPGAANRPFNSTQDDNCICASSCAIAWLGGVERTGTAGFHRVYSQDPSITASKAREIRRFFDDEIDAYLDEVGAPSFIPAMIESFGPEGLGFPTPEQLAILMDNVDHSTTIFAACQAFHMPVGQKQRMFQIEERVATTGVSGDEQRELNRLQINYQQEFTCREQVRRRELFRAQEALAEALSSSE